MLGNSLFSNHVNSGSFPKTKRFLNNENPTSNQSSSRSESYLATENSSLDFSENQVTQINNAENNAQQFHDNNPQVGQQTNNQANFEEDERFEIEEDYEIFFKRFKSLLKDHIPEMYKNLNFHELKKIPGMQNNLNQIDSK